MSKKSKKKKENKSFIKITRTKEDLLTIYDSISDAKADGWTKIMYTNPIKYQKQKVQKRKK